MSGVTADLFSNEGWVKSADSSADVFRIDTASLGWPRQFAPLAAPRASGEAERVAKQQEGRRSDELNNIEYVSSSATISRLG